MYANVGNWQWLFSLEQKFALWADDLQGDDPRGPWRPVQDDES
jgi:hypothetical protein